MKKITELTISQIRNLVKENKVTTDQWHQLQADGRQGVQLLVKQECKKQTQKEQLRQNFLQKTHFEKQFWQRQQLVAGIDEVGRGPLAGPVVAAAVVLPPNVELLGVNDSKQLSAKKRRQLYSHILAVALDVSVSLGDRELIDQYDIYHATEKIMAQAVNNLTIPVDHLLVDAMHIPLPIKQTKIIKGDIRSISIAAASIIAKVYRDELMQTYAQIYPHYCFENNAGYGTKEHLAGLQQWGICPLHRHSFAPIKKYL